MHTVSGGLPVLASSHNRVFGCLRFYEKSCSNLTILFPSYPASEQFSSTVKGSPTKRSKHQKKYSILFVNT